MPVGVDVRAARMRGRRWLTGLVLVAVTATAGGWVAGQSMLSPREVAARSQAPAATIITAEVVSEKITSAVVARGDIRAVDVVRVGHGRLVPPGEGSDGAASDEGEAGAGDGVLTEVFAGTGDKVSEGQAVVEVDGRPVIVLAGAKAAYRDVKPLMSGPDVEQLQRSLARLGHYSGTVTGVFDQRTKAAVSRLYEKLGYSTPDTDTESGEDADPTAVQAARDSRDDAAAALAHLERQRAEATTALAARRKEWRKARRTDPDGAGPEPTYEGPSPSEIAQAERALRRAREALAAETARRGAMVPRTEVVFVPRLPASVTQIGTATGYAPASPLFTLTPSAMVLTAQVAERQAGLLHEGDRVEVDLPGGSVSATIADISSSRTPGKVAIEVATPKSLPFSLAGDDVKVTFLAAATRGAVLAVPQGAISSDASGALSVIVEKADKSLIRVPVEVGVSGDSLVEVTPIASGSLREGDKVVIGG